MLLNSVWWRQHANLAHYSGSVTASINGNYANNFYVIFPVTDPPGSDQKVNIGIDCQCWDYTNANTTATTSFDGVTSRTPTIQASQTQADTAAPQGIRIFDSKEIAYNYLSGPTSGTYGFTKWGLTNILPAHVSAFCLPRITKNYQDDTAKTDAGGDSSFNQQFDISNDAFNIGQPCRGLFENTDYEAGTMYDSLDGSVGSLIQHQNARTYTTGSMITSTTPALFGWMHPAGLYVAGTGGSLAYRNIFGTTTGSNTDNTIKIRGRAYNDSVTPTLNLVMVGRWDTGTKLKFTIYEADGTTEIDNYEWALPSNNIAVPGIRAAISVVDYDPTEDYNVVKIEAYCSTAAGVEINSLAIYENSTSYIG
jgi:hypothetical protein